MIFYESSAKKNINVEEAFRELANKAVELQITDPTKRTTSIMELEAKKKRKSAQGNGCRC